MKISEKIIQYRWLVIVIFAFISIIFMVYLPGVEIDTDIKSQLPKDMPSRLETDKIDSLFGGTELLMVVIQSDDILKPETLQRVQKISNKIKRIKGVEKVLSLFELKSIKSVDGALLVNPAVDYIPHTPEEEEQ